MAVFKRGNVYWFGFMWRGQRIQQSTKQANKQAAREIESAYRTKLAKGEVGIIEQAPIPMYADFAKRFEKEMETVHAAKPATVTYYKNSLKIRQRARDNRRPIGAELARILEYALPAMYGFEERMEQARMGA